MSGEGAGLQFVDTNVLVYAHDRSAGQKYTRAKALVEELWHLSLCTGVTPGPAGPTFL